MARAVAIESTIPARLDRLPWSRWHWRVVIALGVSWLLDGLEVTVVGSIGPALAWPEALGLSAGEVGWAASAYVGGAVAGALCFGRLADRLGRKRMFLVTLALYVAATLLTACSFDFASFAACRALTGFGIGGEYAAINSAIDELIPARVRGAVDLGINGTFWIGAALGAGASLVLLDPRWFAPGVGWRVAFALGALLGIAIVLVRRNVPESPRWLLAHGRVDEAERIVAEIEARIGARHPLEPVSDALALRALRRVPWRDVLHVLAVRYRGRAVLGVTLMSAQAFFYNALFFTYALLLVRFYGVAEERAGAYIFPFALANFLGPLALGRLFDSIGRRVMITATYAVSGLGLVALGWGFARGGLGVAGLALGWSAIFFVASAAASSAYLTVSELFPLEMRAISISLFYAVGTALGGFVAPALFGALIERGSRDAIFAAWALAGALMCAAALVAARLAVDAERRPLEAICPPLGADEIDRGRTRPREPIA